MGGLRDLRRWVERREQLIRERYKGKTDDPCHDFNEAFDSGAMVALRQVLRQIENLQLTPFERALEDEDDQS